MLYCHSFKGRGAPHPTAPHSWAAAAGGRPVPSRLLRGETGISEDGELRRPLLGRDPERCPPARPRVARERDRGEPGAAPGRGRRPEGNGGIGQSEAAGSASRRRPPRARHAPGGGHLPRRGSQGRSCSRNGRPRPQRDCAGEAGPGGGGEAGGAGPGADAGTRKREPGGDACAAVAAGDGKGRERTRVRLGPAHSPGCSRGPRAGAVSSGGRGRVRVAGQHGTRRLGRLRRSAAITSEERRRDRPAASSAVRARCPRGSLTAAAPGPAGSSPAAENGVSAPLPRLGPAPQCRAPRDVTGPSPGRGGGVVSWLSGRSEVRRARVPDCCSRVSP